MAKSFVNKMIKQSASTKAKPEAIVSDQAAYLIGQRMDAVARSFFPHTQLFRLEELYNSQTRNMHIFDDFDMVIPIGGDGTFLSCAYFIPNNKKVIFGVNSNPQKSLGFLLGMHFEEPFERKCERLFEDLVQGNFELFHRKRFLVHSPQLRDFCGAAEYSADTYALIGLNDLFFSSYNQAQTSRYAFIHDEKRDQSVRSTGCLIYTGSGSSAWAFGMNKVPNQTVEHILDYLQLPRERAAEVQAYLQDKHTFSCRRQKLAFKHREPTILNQELSEQGYGKQFLIENLTHEACVSIDGFEYFLDYGERLEVSLAPVERDLLCLRPVSCQGEESLKGRGDDKFIYKGV